ncbi:DUF3265 domain-containing protein [Vibrio sp. SCSIO 43140]|nr:DUF3265 domain-containing protein [Vibrio sp. SCSIO 43140]
MRYVWHFYYALRLVSKVVCGDFGIMLPTPHIALCDLKEIEIYG